MHGSTRQGLTGQREAGIGCRGWQAVAVPPIPLTFSVRAGAPSAVAVRAAVVLACTWPAASSVCGSSSSSTKPSSRRCLLLCLSQQLPAVTVSWCCLEWCMTYTGQGDLQARPIRCGSPTLGDSFAWPVCAGACSSWGEVRGTETTSTVPSQLNICAYSRQYPAVGVKNRSTCAPELM